PEVHLACRIRLSKPPLHHVPVAAAQRVQRTLCKPLATTRSELWRKRNRAALQYQRIRHAPVRLNLPASLEYAAPVGQHTLQRLPPLAMPALLQCTGKLEGLVGDQCRSQQQQRAQLVVLEQDEPA